MDGGEKVAGLGGLALATPQAGAAGRDSNIPQEMNSVPSRHQRVGINVSDVIVKGDDIHGNGENVASRLEGLCERGEVYVSGTVYHQAAGKLAARGDRPV